MSKNRTFAPDEPAPSDWPNSLSEFISTLAENFQVTIGSDPTTLQVTAGADNDQVAIGVNGRWRYITATISHASPGGGVARTLDVWVTATDNSFAPGSPGEVDSTDYSFALAIVESGVPPAGAVLSRLVGHAQWDGTKFTRVDQLVPVVALHGHRHATGGPDPIAPADIGAANAGDAPPVGAIMPYAGSGDPVEGDWVIADGRLIDKTVYANFFGRVGHVYNLGVDPGSNKVKIPDKRGKKSIGAINMGSAAGAGPSDNAHAQLARGVSAGEVVHTLSVPESPSHNHGGATGGHAHPMESFHVVAGGGGLSGVAGVAGGDQGAMFTDGAAATISAQGGGGSHNNLDPSEVDCWIVRIA